MAGIERQRRLRRCQRFLEPALLRLKDAQHLPRRQHARVHRQHLTVEFLGFDQLSALVKNKALFVNVLQSLSFACTLRR